MALSYKGIFLTKEESRSAENTGWKFAYNNKDRWEDIGLSDPQSEIATYDVSTTYVVHNNTAYTIFKDYVIPQENTRLFIFKDRNLATDNIEEESEEGESETP